MQRARGRSLKRLALYLLDLSVRGDGLFRVALVSEPGADGLQGAVRAAPAAVICAVLHVMVVAIHALDQVNLQKRRSTIRY